uniref:M16C_associated domain-containing protein n=1 Tax=Steinernema glaseri TaxID=37863 RepID=A0A1I7YJH9_9BILA
MASEFDPVDSLKFLYMKPVENWLDYYVDKNKFTELVLIGRDDQKEQILTLLQQFAEQALNVQREHEIIIAKEVDVDDVIYSKKKLSRIWMSACACFASLHWDINLVFERLNMAEMTGLMHYLLLEAFSDHKDGILIFDQVADIESKDLKNEKLFFGWLFVLWIFKVDQQCRFQQPFAKPTVSNPSAQVDNNLVQAERFVEASRELQKYMKRSVALLNRIIEASQGETCQEVLVPEVSCLLSPMKDVLPPMEGFPSNEALLEVIMRPDFSHEHIKVSPKDFVTRSTFELLRVHMRAGHFKKSTELCHQLIGMQTSVFDGPPEKRLKLENRLCDVGGIMWMDPDEFRGYCEANDVAPIKPTDQPIALQQPSNETLKAMNAGAGQKEMLLIDRLTVEGNMGQSSSELQMQLACEMIAASLRNGDPVDMKLVFFLCCDKTAPQVLAAVLVREAHQRHQRGLRTILAFIYFLCGISSTFAASIEKTKDQSTVVKYRKPIEIRQTLPSIPAPRKSELAAFRRSDCFLWNLLTCFNYDELKQMVDGNKNFRMPTRYKMPEMISEPILKIVGPQCEFQALYLGKVEQLGSMMSVEYEIKLNPLGNDVHMRVGDDKHIVNRLIYEVVRMKIEKFNKCIHRMPVQDPATIEWISNAITGSATLEHYPPLQMHIVLIVSFFLNLSDWDGVLKKICPVRFKAPVLDMARILARNLFARFVLNTTAAQQTALLEEWWKFMMPTFENKRTEKPSIGFRQMETLLDAIKEARAISFLLNFLGKLFNHTVMTQQRADSAGHPIGLHRLFLEKEDMIPFNPTSNLSSRCVEDALHTVLRNAMVVNPTNAFWLRTYGDFKFAKSCYREAMIFYLESLISCGDPLFTGFPENVVDDVMWMKMIKCCQHCQYPTLAAILVQMMNDPSAQYSYAYKIIKEAQLCQDAGTAYLPLVADPTLAEYLTEAYYSNGQKMNCELLSKVMCEQALNHNNPLLICRGEMIRRKSRFIRVLFSHFFDVHDLHTVS